MKNMIKRVLQKVRNMFYVITYKMFCLFTKLDDKKVLFLSASRDSLTGNFQFVHNEINRRNKYEINMFLKKTLKTRFVFFERFDLIKKIAVSKYIFLDDFYPMIYALKLRNGTKLIQLWHAMGAYKRVGYARGSKEGAPVAHSLTHKNYTGAIVSSESIRKDYAEAFGISIDKIHALGIPRTDIFFDKKYKDNIIKRYYNKYPILKNKKVILFAPTFRGAGQKSAHYNFNWINFKELKREFEKDYVCIIKLHPFIKNRPEYNFINDSFYLNLTSEREINDILFFTDILITDYSSVIFEYSFFKRPVIFFVPDLEDYKDSRNFFYEFDKYTYGDVVSDFGSLIESIKNAKVDKEKLKEFNNYFCSSCDGKATKRVVNFYLDR